MWRLHHKFLLRILFVSPFMLMNIDTLIITIYSTPIYFLYFSTAVPERPEDLGVTAVTKDSISLAWRPPKYDGGAEVTSYVLEVRQIGKDHFTCVGTDNKLMDRRFIHEGLKEGATYEFRVSAVNQIGQGKPSFSTKPITCKDELGKLQTIYVNVKY